MAPGVVVDHDPGVGTRAFRTLLPIATSVLLQGCATVEVGANSGARGISRIYVGVVKVVTPDRDGAVSAIDVQALGIGWDAGPFVGWRSGSWITADPTACGLLVVIRAPAQAEQAAKVLQSLGGREACVADYTRTLRP